MTALNFLRRGCYGKHSPPLPPPDAEGLSRLALNQQLLLHVLANPNALPPEQDDIFVYAALAGISGSAAEVREAVFWQLGAWNLPGGSPAGIRLGVERRSGLVWQSLRLGLDLLDESRFFSALQRFIATALTRQAALQEILLSPVFLQNETPFQDEGMLILRNGGVRV